MSLSKGFGKKQFETKDPQDLENLDEYCCEGSEVTRLEYLLGKPGKIGDKTYRPQMWIVMCEGCGKTYKIVEGFQEVEEICTDPGKKTLRWGRRG